MDPGRNPRTAAGFTGTHVESGPRRRVGLLHRHRDAQGVSLCHPKRWQCEIVPHASAGCRPAASSTLAITGAPTEVPGVDGEPTAPNTIVIDRGSDVRFVDAATDTGIDTDTETPAATLPFGKVLQVAGFRCNVQEATGVSCGSESSGKGFTFSADGYTAVYTDVPQ